jgi:uncharacterized protein (TIGR02453 family)
MLKEDTLKFLEELKKNNNRDWFTENKAWYERSRTDVELLIAQVTRAIAGFDPEIGLLDPKKCLFRIYRDVRFSQDKSPYKTHFGAIFRPRTAERISGYYMHIDPQEIFLSFGYYMADAEQLKKIRRGIYNDFDTFSEILNDKTFRREIGDLYRDEDALQRVPNGFDKDHPAAGYLKLKHFYVCKPLTKSQLLSEDFVKYAAEIYKIMYPLGEFLDDIVNG